MQVDTEQVGKKLTSGAHLYNLFLSPLWDS
jgi:hypothetical protein